MDGSEEYNKLLKAYQDLQLRVTQFSFIEQKLINTQDKLDYELLLYKRLQNFNSAALKDLSMHDFVRLVAESVIDVLELESAVVLFKNETDDVELFLEGFPKQDISTTQYIDDTILLANDLEEGKACILNPNHFYNIPSFIQFYSGLFFQFTEKELGYSFVIIGFISIKKAPIYQLLQARHETIFSVFAQQAQSLLANKIKNDKIKNQIEKISSSEIELKKLSLIATKTNNSVIISDAEGRIEWVNEAFTKASGYTLEESKGKKPKEFLQGRNTDKAELKKLSEAIYKKENIQVTLINYTKEGAPYYNQIEVTPVFDEQGNHLNYISLQKDITQELINQREILRINSRFELITSKSNIGIWEWEASTNKVVWNDTLLLQYGVDKDNYDKMDFVNFWNNSVHPDDSERVEFNTNYLMTSDQEVLEQEYKIIKYNDKEVRIVRDVTIAERDEKGTLLRLIGSTLDITEERKNELELQHNLRQQELLSELALGLNNVSDFDSRINLAIEQVGLHTQVSRVYIFQDAENSKVSNNTFEWCNKNISSQKNELQGLSYESIPSLKSILLDKGLLYAEDISVLPNDLVPVLQSHDIKSIIIYPLYVKGVYFGFIGFDECLIHKKWLKSELELLRTISGIISNAFERDLSEKTLLASEEKYRSIIENINIGLLESNVNGEIVFQNKKFFELTLLDNASLLVIRKDAEADLKEKVLNGNILSYTKIDQSVYEIEINRLDHKLITLLVSCAPSINQEGEVSGYINAYLDITDIKQIEKAVLKKNDELKKINTELDNFVYSVSHDLRSPLLSIRGILDLISKTALLDDKTLQYLNLAETSAKRLDGTIQEILEYSKNARFDIELEEFNIVDMLNLIFEDLKFTSNNEVSLLIEIDGPPMICSDKSRMNTLLKNLIGNSVKYKRKSDTDSYVKFKLHRLSDHLLMEVEDNGMGISEKSIDKVFDMFYRGTKSSVGTGLGLYICKEIVNKLGGSISVKSELGIGTSMSISIPNNINYK